MKKRTKDPVEVDTGSNISPEKPSTPQTDLVYEAGLAAQKSLFEFLEKASKDSGRNYRGVFGSFRPDRVIKEWYENNPSLAEDYNKAVIAIGSASSAKEVIQNTEDAIEESGMFGSQGFGKLGKRERENPRLLTSPDLSLEQSSAFTPDNKFESKLAPAAYRTVELALDTDGFLDETNVPIEFLMILKKGIDEAGDVEALDLGLVDFPENQDVPEFIPQLTAVRTNSGGYNVFDPEGEVTEIAFHIPANFERYGDLLESLPDADNPNMTLPTGFVSNDRLDYLESATDRVMQARPDKIDPDTLTFTQMLARERQTDNEKFTWRGQEYING